MFVLYGSEMLPLILREGYTLHVSENKLLKKRFVPKKDEVSERFMIVHIEELCDLYRSPCDVKRMKCRRL
jgi:hypothetical protein